MSFDRNARSPMRWRRAWQQVGGGGATSSLLVDAPFSLATGRLSLSLDAAGGLEVSSGALRVKIIDTSITRNASGLGVALRTNAGLSISSGVGILLPASSGLQTLAGGLSILLPANSGLGLAAGGLSLSLATLTVKGGVLMAALVADQAVLTDNSGGTSGAGTIAAVGIAVTDPADAPVSADALRDDLVATTIPSIETELSNLRNAVATLAAYSTTLEDKINAILAGQKTAGQMSSV